MARPKKAVIRQRYIKVSCTIAEYKLIEKFAEKHGISKAEFVRMKSLGHKLRPRMTLEEADHYRKLTGMSNNLNQLAKSANQGKILTTKILDTLESIDFAIDKLR